MTETEAKRLLFAKLETMTDAECPLAWVGDVLLETPNVYIIDGSLYAEGENPKDSAGFCAVDKETGKSGMILPYPGPRSHWTLSRISAGRTGSSSDHHEHFPYGGSRPRGSFSASEKSSYGPSLWRRFPSFCANFGEVEGNNMTIEEARKILLERLRPIAPKDFPLVWVSEPVSEDEVEFLFKASFYAEGEDPEADALPHAVNKQTGKVRVLLNLC